MDNSPVTIVKVLNATPGRVWKAITDKNEMKQWYFDLKEFKPEVGFVFEFTGGDEEKQYLHHCMVLKVEKNRLLSHSWTYPGYDGSSVVTWELFDEDGKTRLVLTHEGLHTFPASNPAFAKKNFEAGWSEIVGKMLPDYLSKEG